MEVAAQFSVQYVYIIFRCSLPQLVSQIHTLQGDAPSFQFFYDARELISCNNTFDGMFMIFHGSSNYAHSPYPKEGVFLRLPLPWLSLLRPKFSWNSQSPS